MQSKNLAVVKAHYLQKEARSLFPKDKENVSQEKKILNIKQWVVGDTKINLLETDSLASSMLLAQKWPFQLLNQQRRIIFAFMAGNDTLKKGSNGKQKKGQKNLLNVTIIFKTTQKQQPFLSMLAVNQLINSIKLELNKGDCEPQLHIRWKHDVLLDHMKVGQIFLKHISVQHNFYTQLNVQVNVKSIPKNFGAYDFQPTYLEKHVKHQIDLVQFACNIITGLTKQLNDEKPLNERKKEIKQKYQKELIYLNEKVTIYDTKYQHIHHTGKFLGVNDQGNAILDKFQQPFKDGNMKFNCEGNDYLNLYR